MQRGNLDDLSVYRMSRRSGTGSPDKDMRKHRNLRRRRSDASTYGVPAIYHECVTDHEACCGTAKPKHSACNLLGATEAADGYVFQHRVEGVSLRGHHPVEHRSMDDARAYGIDANAPCGIVESCALGEPEHAVLG